jgi:hypothetical protein
MSPYFNVKAGADAGISIRGHQLRGYAHCALLHLAYIFSSEKLLNPANQDDLFI